MPTNTTSKESKETNKLSEGQQKNLIVELKQPKENIYDFQWEGSIPHVTEWLLQHILTGILFCKPLNVIEFFRECLNLLENHPTKNVYRVEWNMKFAEWRSSDGEFIKKRLPTSKSECKDYLEKHDISQLFEALLAGIMYYRPRNHVTYLRNCLDFVEKNDIRTFRWNLFLDMREDRLKGIPNKFEVKKHGYDLDATFEYVKGDGDEAPKLNEKEKYEFFHNKISDNRQVREIAIELLSSQVPFILGYGGPACQLDKFCAQIAMNLGFCHIDMGHELQKMINNHPEEENDYWLVVKQCIEAGFLVPDNLINELFAVAVNKNKEKRGFVISGYPRTEGQLRFLLNYVKNVIGFIIDYSKEYIQRRLNIDDNTLTCEELTSRFNRLNAYDDETLSACEVMYRRKNLEIIREEKAPELIYQDILRFLKKALSDCGFDLTITKMKLALPLPNIEPVFLEFRDVGRKPLMPVCPVVLIFGGPGSGKSSAAIQILQQRKGWIHVNVEEIIRNYVFALNNQGDTQEEIAIKTIKENVKDENTDCIVVEHWDIEIEYLRNIIVERALSADGILLEGFPKNERELNLFNQYIGGVNSVLCLDCTHDSLISRLLVRGEMYPQSVWDKPVAIESRIGYFLLNTIRVIDHYDDKNILRLINGNQDGSLVFKDLMNCLRFDLHEENTLAAEIDKNENAAKETEPSTDAKQNFVEIVFIIGKQCSGKKTLAAMMCERLNFIIIPLEELIKEEVEKEGNSERGEYFQSILQAKQNIPLDEIVSSLQNFIKKKHGNKGKFILIDFPRDLIEAKLFETEIKAVDHVLYLQASDEFLIQRKREQLKEIEEAKSPQVVKGKAKTNLPSPSPAEKSIVIESKSDLGALAYYYTKVLKLRRIDVEQDRFAVFRQVKEHLKSKL